MKIVSMAAESDLSDSGIDCSGIPLCFWSRPPAALQIREIMPDSGCTYVMIGQSRLGPGETTLSEVRFNSAGMLGNAHKSIAVVSDDPANSRAALTFQAGVVQEIMPS